MSKLESIRSADSWEIIRQRCGSLPTIFACVHADEQQGAVVRMLKDGASLMQRLPSRLCQILR